MSFPDHSSILKRLQFLPLDITFLYQKHQVFLEFRSCKTIRFTKKAMTVDKLSVYIFAPKRLVFLRCITPALALTKGKRLTYKHDCHRFHFSKFPDQINTKGQIQKRLRASTHGLPLHSIIKTDKFSTLNFQKISLRSR